MKNHTNSTFYVGGQRVLIFPFPYGPTTFPPHPRASARSMTGLKLKQMGRLPFSHSFLGVGFTPGCNPVPSSQSRFRPLVPLADVEVFVLGRMSDG